MKWSLLLKILIMIESGGCMNSVGDKHLENKAYGILQIRKPYLQDVNEIADTDYSLKQVRNSRTLSRWTAIVYIRHYGKHYERKTGNKLTIEVAARIHNGGPYGWKKNSTIPYLKKVRKWLHRIEVQYES